MPEEKSQNAKLKREHIFLSFISTFLSGAALWYAWLRFNRMLNRPELNWYAWIQPAAMALVGVLCLLAAILLILGKPSGMSVFKAGLSIIPLLLFSNLVILVFRVIQNIIQGRAESMLIHLFTEPRNLLIPIVVITLILLGYLGRNSPDKNDA
jgi:hypothetical protein